MNDDDDVVVESAEAILESLSSKDREASKFIEKLEKILDDAKISIEEKEENARDTLKEISSIQQSIVDKQAAFQETKDEFTQEIDSRVAEAESSANELTLLSGDFSKLEDKTESELKKLEEATRRNEELLAEIEGLLPGATSSGLAKSFSDRKKVYGIPSFLWSAILIGTLAGLFALGVYDFKNIDPVANKTILSYFIERLPIVAPAVWLAIYAGRKHGQSSRLEEEYAHKEALARSFEGFKQQIMEMEEQMDDSDNQMSTRFVTQIMDAIALHPSRVFQGKQENVTPMEYLQFWKREEKEPSDKGD